MHVFKYSIERIWIFFGQQKCSVVSKEIHKGYNAFACVGQPKTEDRFILCGNNFNYFAGMRTDIKPYRGPAGLLVRNKILNEGQIFF